MRDDAAIRMAVETAAPGVRLIRLAGRLDRSGAEALGRLIDAQCACGRSAAHLIVDLSGIGAFDAQATETLGAVVARSRCEGVHVHLAGCGGRAELLPLRARQVLRRCGAYPSAEVAVRALAERAGASSPARTPSPATASVPVPEPRGAAGPGSAAEPRAGAEPEVEPEPPVAPEPRAGAELRAGAEAGPPPAGAAPVPRP
ncbi:STAS domain-containing protein [Pseudonocardia nematodicida]|uniref:STAS domain-containing protein n=1 Tax=Pseudonocardia nematodicida TaxID=1206997 RepID=A0ABV1K6M0_9PSEU